MNVTKAYINVDFRKRMHIRVNEFEVGVNESIFSGNKQQKVYYFVARMFANIFHVQPLYLSHLPFNLRHFV